MIGKVLFGSSPGASAKEKVKIAFWRATRTLIQGIAGAFPSAGAGAAILSTNYWQTFGVACLTALVTAFVSFLNNVATIFPQDPTQTDPT